MQEDTKTINPPEKHINGHDHDICIHMPVGYFRHKQTGTIYRPDTVDLLKRGIRLSRRVRRDMQRGKKAEG